MDRRYRWGALGAVIAAAVAIAAVVLSMRGGEDIRVQTAEVTTGRIARRVMVTGRLEPARMVEVGSQASGTIASIEADFNTQVKAGQILARLDPASFQTRLAEAEAGVAQARAERARFQAALEDARMKFENARTLAGDEQIARAELDLARTTMQQAAADVKGAEAGIAAAQAAVTQARVSLEHTVIRSPIDGIVIGRHVDVGQTLAASVNAPVLFTIGDLRRMQLLAEVSEGDVGGVQPGSTVRFEIESLGPHAFTGTVAQVRLEPLVEQAASTSGSASGAAASAPTTGTASSTPGSSPAPTGTPQPGSSTAASGSAAQGAAPSSPVSIASARQTPGATGTVGVVTYIAVIDVDSATQEIPPGGTAIVTLPGSERSQAVRIPNNALTFAPSAKAFEIVDQDPPALDRTERAPAKNAATRHGYVWKFENGRFVPIEVETGVADDSWTELVKGDVRPHDRLVTAAAPAR